MGGLAEFFFNIVPASLILLSANIIFEKNINNLLKYFPEGEGFRLAIFVEVSLFIGFLLQLLTKRLKEEYLYKYIWNDLAKQHKDLYDETRKYLKKKKLIFIDNNSSIEKDRRQVFFTIDNYLSATGGGRLLPHFSSRSAYWSNTGWASGVIGTLAVFSLVLGTSNVHISLIFVLIAFSVFFTYISFCTFIDHQKQHYEIALRTFLAIVVIEKK